MSLLLLFGAGSGGGTTVTVVTGHTILTGKVAVVSQTGHQVIGVVTGHVSLSGKTLTVSRTEHQVIIVVPGHVVLSGKVLEVTQTMVLTLTVQQARRLEAVIRLHGLIDPLVIVHGVSRGDGTVTQTLSGSTAPITVHTTGLPTIGNPTAALLDKLARWYGLIDDFVEEDEDRTDGVLSQSVVTVAGTTTVTTL